MAREQAPVSSLVLAILGLLSEQPRSGYDLRKVFATTAMGQFSDSPGAVYPALKRCAKLGWLRSETHNSGSLRPRQVFSLTARGRTALAALLSRPVMRRDLERRPDELLLRFAFSGGILGRRGARRFLTGYLREVEASLADLRGQAKSIGKIPPCVRLAMEHGIEGYETDARWARRALKEL